MKLIKPVWATSLVLALAAVAVPAQAESKKDLVQKLLTLQQPALDATAKNMTEAPARQMAGGAQQMLMQAVEPEKREAAAKKIDAELKKYADGSLPIVKASVAKVSQSTVADAIDKQFTEDELKQLLVMLQSPVLNKYQAAMPELNKTLVEAVVQDSKPKVDPKIQAADDAIRKILDEASGGKLSQAAQQKGAAGKTKPAK